jgi:anti-anti-sigma regulatory factor
MATQQQDDTLLQAPPQAPEIDTSLLRELVAHLRDQRSELREEWARRITDAQLLSAMSPDEIFNEVTAVYDNYVDTLETGSVERLQAYAGDLSERIIPRGVETHEVLGIVLLLRDVLARSLFEKYQDDFDLLNRILDAYEPAANRIAVTVGVSFVRERERVIGQQQAAIRELSTPVLQVRERHAAGAAAHRAAPERHSDESGESRGARHNGRSRYRSDCGEPPGSDGCGVPVDGRGRHPHGTLIGDRSDPCHAWCRPEHAQHGGRLAERHRGGRTTPSVRDGRVPRLVRRLRAVNRAMPVPILKQGDYLIASIQSALSDSEVLELQNDLLDQVGRYRSRGIIIDVAAMDVIDSFASRSLRTVALTTRLRGAETVIVGIQPEVAFAMVQFGITMGDVSTALDLEEGLDFLRRFTGTNGA